MITSVVILLTILTVRLDALTNNYSSSVLLVGNIKNYCDMTCNNAKHTMCDPDPLPSANCDRFHYLDLKNYMMDTWNAHNGIRNREAKLEQIANMRRMEWDDELALMAKYWIMKCEKYNKDPCTSLERNSKALMHWLPFNKATLFHFQGQLSYTLVNQNNVFLVSKYFPEFFYQLAIRYWYEQKKILHKQDTNDTVRFSEINNYTQLVWADTWRVGCAAASHSNGYAFICNYHSILTKSAPIWRAGAPCSSCPRALPLCSRYFENLCTGDFAQQINPNFVTTMAVFLIILLL